MTSSPESVGTVERARLMSEYSIGFDGRHYETRGYRYDRLADAVSYAQRMRGRSPSTEPLSTVAPQDLPAVMPTQADREVMAPLGIAFRQGAYEFGGSRYDCLGDAVHYARLLTQHAAAR